MKKFFKILISHPILIIAIIILIVYLPSGLSLAPEGLRRQHASTIGIDLVDGQVEVSILSYYSTESQGFKENYMFVSGKGESIPEALRQIEINSGREVALTHTTVIVISEAVARDGVEKYLDYFYRLDAVSNNAHIICSTNSAKEVLQYEQDTVNAVKIGLEELALYNSQSVLFNDINLENFYKGYFSQVKSSFIGLLEIDSQATQGGGGESADAGGAGGGGNSGGGGGDSGGGGSSSSPTDLKIKSFDKLVVLKNGKYKTVLDREDIKATNFINAKTKNTGFEIKGINDDLYDNVDMSLQIERNVVDRKAYFENDRPVVEFNILMQVSINEIKSDVIKREYFSTKENLFTEAVVKKIENHVKTQFSALMKKLIANQTDIVGIFSLLYDQQYSRFNQWYENLADKDDFLANITYKFSVTPTLTI